MGNGARLDLGATRRVADDGAGNSRAAGVVAKHVSSPFGSVVAHTAVLLVFQLGQPRIFFSMARDGLLPSFFASVHPRFKTPHVTTILTGVAVGGIAAFATVDEMVSLTNIGTLFAFILVCVGVMVLRHKDPIDRDRSGFRLARTCCRVWVQIVRAFDLLPAGRFLLALCRLAGAGSRSFFSYGYTRSAVGQKMGRPTRTPVGLKLARYVSSWWQLDCS